jgi:hypothetical protein
MLGIFRAVTIEVSADNLQTGPHPMLNAAANM